MSKLTFIALLFPLLTMSQIEETKKDKEIISFSYNETIYQKIAHDTIKKMYLNQKKMSEHSKSLGDDAISIKYDLNKLSIYIIPKFRLKRIAYELYTCDKNIEEFIEFEEKFKYMSAIVAKEKEFITMQTIPHPYFEIERVNTPDFRLKVDKFVYEESILKNFVSNEEYLINIQKDINKRSENFFFGIYGLWDVIFEVEKGTGKLFANKYDYNSVIHLPANEYLRKYEGQTRIRELSRGYYEDIDGTGFLEQIPCGSIESSEKQVFLKVNYD